MHVTIVAYGTWGDVRPCIALGLALKDAGYCIRLCVTEDFAAWVDGTGLDTHIIPINTYEVMQPVSSTTNPLQLRLDIHQAIAPALIRASKDLFHAAEGTDILIVNEWLLGVASGVAKAHRIKLANLAMQPRIQTRQTPIAAMPPWPNWAPFRETYNLLTYDLANYFHWFHYARLGNSLRKIHPELAHLSPGGYAGLFEKTPSLTSISQHVMARPGDWADHHHLTGYLFYDDEGWRPPAKLVDFIHSGEAPIYVGFGSIQDRHPDETTRLILSALQQTQQRAVLHSGWSNLGDCELPDTVYRLDYVPHSWLFPQTAAVVHHAGAGTTAAALRAGVPSVTVPHSGDQPYWARRLHELGAGTIPLPRYRLNAAELAERIDRAVGDTQMRRRAAALGEKIRGENSADKAVAAITRLLH